MDLLQQLVIDGLQRGELTITASRETRNWVEGRCFQTLMRIKEVLEDENLEDEECFLRIEGILDAFENAGVCVLGRHDFG